jgi:hypothetical protein
MSTNILTACFERLQTLSYSPAPTVLWPGLNQTPPQDGPWLEAGYFPNEPLDRTWNADSCAEQRGFFQVLVGYRPGDGEIEPSELADAVVAHFPKALDLGGVVVTKQPTRGPSFVDEGDKLFIPVTISYRGFED